MKSPVISAFLVAACTIALPDPAGAEAVSAGPVPMPRLKPVPPVRRDSVPPAPRAPSAAEAGGPSLASCLAELRQLGAEAVAEESVETERGCRIANPVRLVSLRSGKDRVVFSGPPKLDCRFAVAAARWFADVVSPLARHHLGQPVARIHVGPGYVCRGRNGARGGKLSEHAFGNAIDIVALTLAGGTRLPISDDPVATGRRKAFFAAMRTSACGYFTTVLGPGSNAAHADHYHVDLGKHGKTGNYRICE